MKKSLLGVPGDTLDQFGAVSKETAEAMAEGISEKTKADYSFNGHERFGNDQTCRFCFGNRGSCYFALYERVFAGRSVYERK